MTGGTPKLDMDAKWDACYDLTLRRFFYSSLAGAASALLFFRSPVTRWGVIAFSAGIGLGSAYTDCSHIMGGALPKWPVPSGGISPSESAVAPHSNPEE
ncbi:hypothetical protein KP509_21G031400 [Ceratopteris richardii]|uniref:MICOS complex subunit Mic10 n=1 Tax=Ceratopteris richardii TaxID=49495 RepID=A0A8T2SAK9_CERRI|nr:hypothetical protein KP509_21G031400 [Ceratopteris richardii]